jgi:iron complex transport system permease protein
MRKNSNRYILFLFAFLVLSAVIGLYKGAVDIPFSSYLTGDNRIIVQLRVMRLLMAMCAGSGLAVCGIVMQAILRNSLAEPYLLGTSSGAGLGAVAVISAGASSLFLAPAAFIGALLSTMLVYLVARRGRRVSEHSLILAGVIISMALSAVIVFLISISRNEALYGITWWLWGNLQVLDGRLLGIAGSIVGAGIVAVYFFSRDLNAVSTGEEEAMHLGIDTEALKKILIALVALMTASLVCVCGIIGFVGLIIPHAARLLVGPDHKSLIPAACLLGSAFMIVCDVISRCVFVPVEIPIGVITALVGAPLFILLLRGRRGA